MRQVCYIDLDHSWVHFLLLLILQLAQSSPQHLPSLDSVSGSSLAVWRSRVPRLACTYWTVSKCLFSPLLKAIFQRSKKEAVESLQTRRYRLARYCCWLLMHGSCYFVYSLLFPLKKGMKKDHANFSTFVPERLSTCQIFSFLFVSHSPLTI